MKEKICIEFKINKCSSRYLKFVSDIWWNISKCT